MTTRVLDLTSLAREAVRALPLYAPASLEGALDLSDSVNLWGAPPAALRALAGSTSALVSHYPAPRSEPLAPALLQYLGLDAGDGVRVVTGCGSDDVLDATMRAFGVRPSESSYVRRLSGFRSVSNARLSCAAPPTECAPNRLIALPNALMISSWLALGESPSAS